MNAIGNIRAAFTEVFARISYIALASTTATVVLGFAILLPNIPLIFDVFTTSSAPFMAKLAVATSLLGGIGTNFSVFSAAYTILTAILFGVLVAMIAYVFRKKHALLGAKATWVGLGGTLSGIFGVGCAACGSFLLMTFLSSAGAVGALAFLPLRGGEFGVLSVVLLGVSIVLISRQITKPIICE